METLEITYSFGFGPVSCYYEGEWPDFYRRLCSDGHFGESYDTQAVGGRSANTGKFTISMVAKDKKHKVEIRPNNCKVTFYDIEDPEDGEARTKAVEILKFINSLWRGPICLPGITLTMRDIPVDDFKKFLPPMAATIDTFKFEITMSPKEGKFPLLETITINIASLKRVERLSISGYATFADAESKIVGFDFQELFGSNDSIYLQFEEQFYAYVRDELPRTFERVRDGRDQHE